MIERSEPKGTGIKEVFTTNWDGWPGRLPYPVFLRGGGWWLQEFPNPFFDFRLFSGITQETAYSGRLDPGLF